MGVRILYDADQDMAALYCSTSDFAFGPIFDRGEDYTPANDRAYKFLAWLPADARTYEDRDLEAEYGKWMAAGEPGEETDDDA